MIQTLLDEMNKIPAEDMVEIGNIYPQLSDVVQGKILRGLKTESEKSGIRIRKLKVKPDTEKIRPKISPRKHAFISLREILRELSAR